MKILNVSEKEYSLGKNYLNNAVIHKSNKVDYKNCVCIKPWGYEFLCYESDKVGIWYLKLNKNHSTSLHTHFFKDTIIVVFEGCAGIRLIDDEVIVLNKMDSIFIPKYKFHGISSFSENTYIMEIEIFNNSATFSNKNDLLRIDDQYLRPKTGYESSVNLEKNSLDKYNHFYLNENFNMDINDNNIVVSKYDNNKINFYKSNTYNIILKGQVFCNNLFLKEGSFLSENLDDINIISNDYEDLPIILSIKSDSYIEDSKIIYCKDQLSLLINKFKKINKKIILTSGCFDILHVGHINHLKKAKQLGDLLIVCLSSDEQIKKLKGQNRPVNNYTDRINLFKTISYVDYIVLYDEENIETEKTLDEIIQIVKPDIWTKGNDYDTANIIMKHPTLNNIVLIDNIENKSTSNIINKIQSEYNVVKNK